MKTFARFLVFLLSIAAHPLQAAENPHGLPDGLYSEITTPRGVVVCELFHQKTPMTVANYVGLAEGTLGPEPGKPYYEGLKWHRVVADFVVQGGGGGARIGYQFPDEIVPGLRHEGMGTLQMANGGPDGNGAQYCLMLSPQHRLNYLHTVFGKVVRGMDVLPKIQQGDTMSVKILRLGEAAKAFKADKETFDALVAKAKRYNGPRRPGPDAPFDDPDKVLPTNIARAVHFNYKLVNFERFTGRKLAARIVAKSPAPTDVGFMRALMEQPGAVRADMIAIYYADQDAWQFSINDKVKAAFVRESEVGDPAKLKVALDQLVADATKSAAQIAGRAVTTPDPANPMTPAQQTKLRVDAVLDALIFKLEPK